MTSSVYAASVKSTSSDSISYHTSNEARWLLTNFDAHTGAAVITKAGGHTFATATACGHASQLVLMTWLRLLKKKSHSATSALKMLLVFSQEMQLSILALPQCVSTTYF